MDTQQRPLSPHLQIYRPQLTSVMSIMHRITGVLLSMGLLLLVYCLYALAEGATSYQQAQQFLMSRPGLLVLFLLNWALFYHLANGLRHLFWDLGLGLTLLSSYLSGYLVAISSFAATIWLWLTVN